MVPPVVSYFLRLGIGGTLGNARWTSLDSSSTLLTRCLATIDIIIMPRPVVSCNVVGTGSAVGTLPTIGFLWVWLIKSGCV